MSSDDRLSYELCWLHLSDLHYGDVQASDRAHRETVFARLLDDLEGLSSIGAPTPTVLILTGDIAATGDARSSGEYEQARALVADIHARLSPASSLLVVPGNHDVTRTGRESAATYRMLTAARSGTESIDDLLARDDDTRLLSDRLGGYRNFLESLSAIDSAVVEQDPLGGWSRLVAGNTCSVRFVGVNTALLANDDNDEGALQLGYRQLRSGIDGAVPGEIRILLSHHPLNWLRDWDDVEPLINEYFDVHLSGHLHMPRTARQHVLRNEGLISIGAGLGYDRRGGGWTGAQDYSYSLAALGWNEAGRLMLRMWPRVWVPRAAGWRADHALLPPREDSATLLLRGHERPAAPEVDATSILPTWRDWSNRTIRDFGRRRTAYPLDLTISQLVTQGVHVPAAISGFRQASTIDVNRLADIEMQLSAPGSCSLILGEPGSGKSVASYELAGNLKKQGRDPVLLRVSEFTALLSPGHEYAELMKRAAAGADNALKTSVLIIDGLDEISGSGNSMTLAGEFIRHASEYMAVVVTCRRREFEEEISKWIPAPTFDSLYVLKEWSFEGEFTDYVRRLVGAGLLESTDIVSRVAESRALLDMCRRPLFARMITFVGGADSGEVDSTTRLYSSYFDKLAVTCQATLAELGCSPDIDVQGIWFSGARLVFENHLITDEQVNYTALEALLRREVEVDLPWLRRALAFVLDVFERSMSRRAQFIHYSFLEYFIARSVTDALTNSTDTDVSQTCRRLQRDLPRRVRHFAVQLLSIEAGQGLVQQLKDLYLHAQKTGFHAPIRQTVCNLIAYLASRSLSDSVDVLKGFLGDEVDPFLRNSLLWAICDGGDREGVLMFVRELDADVLRRDFNRGYLLYYHGDLNSDSEPPFVDSYPWRSWAFTRSEVLEMLQDASYVSSVSPARQVIDLYTLFDFAIVRGEVFDGEYAEFLLRQTQRIWEIEELPVEVRVRLLNQSALVLAL